ncbi:hypothetical protein BH23ACT4_BH23ACT4_07660 [soil metagenome]
MKRTTLAVATALLVLVGALPASAHEVSRSELKELRTATAPYHSLDAALADGFVAFSLDPDNPNTPTCFDSPDGGMGVHYVRNIDGIIDANDPEAMVYEVQKNGKLKLVAVEYLIPETEVDPQNPPVLFDHEFHPHSFLPVYILHVWVWKVNPSGTFADFNPDVRPCP